MGAGSKKVADWLARRVQAAKTEADLRKASVRKALTINVKTQNKGRIRTPTNNVIVGLVLCSLGVTLVGMIFLWPRLTGVPARMTVTHCVLHTGKAAQCSGKVPPYGKTIYIWAADPVDLGRDIDVHITGDYASADGYWGVFVLPAVGGLLGVTATYAVVLRRRRAGEQRSGPGSQRRRTPEIPRTPGTEWLPPR
jgi:hypothetical protein